MTGTAARPGSLLSRGRQIRVAVQGLRDDVLKTAMPSKIAPARRLQMGPEKLS